MLYVTVFKLLFLFTSCVHIVLFVNNVKKNTETSERCQSKLWFCENTITLTCLHVLRIVSINCHTLKFLVVNISKKIVLSLTVLDHNI